MARRRSISPLPRFLRREDLVQFFRLTKSGVFLEEGAFEVLFSAYQRWQQKVRDEKETLTVERIRKRLIGAEKLRLQYLIEGKKCLLGYILPHSVPGTAGAGLYQRTGTLFDPVTYLDVRDPIFTEIPGIRLSTSSPGGITIQFTTRRGNFECGTDAIRRFAECCRSSPRLSKEFPETADSLRGCLDPLRRLLERARCLDGGSALLVPEEFVRGERTFLRHGSLLIILRGGRIQEFFDTKGRGELTFLREEIEKLRKRDGDRSSIRGFTPPADKTFHLGKIWVRGMSFLLHPNGLRQYIRLLPRSESRGRFARHYGVSQVLQQLVPAFVRSQALNDEAVRRLPMRYRQAGAKYRRFADWVFIVTDKNVLSSCIVVEKAKRRSAHGRGGARTGESRKTPQTPGSTEGTGS